MKKIICISLTIVILMSFSACEKLSSQQSDLNIGDTDITIIKGEETMELTRRQIDILKLENLPTNYEQLNNSQKRSIIAIEELFSYLDAKYEITFEYVGYRAASNLDKETLIVKPEGGTSADIVTVVRNNGECIDDYATVYYRDAYELMLKNYISTSVSQVEVFSDLETAENVTDSNDLRPNVSATSGIYISQSAAQKINIRDYANIFGQWYVSNANGNSCSFSLYVIPDDIYWSITRFNRTNYSDNVISKTNIIIKSNGSLVIK